MTLTTVVPTKAFSLTVSQKKNQAFIYVAAVMVVIVGVTSSIYFSSQYFLTLNQFNEVISTVEPGDTISELEAQIAELFNQNKNDAFPRQIALYEQAQLSALLNVPNPTETDRQAFATAITGGINAAQTATQYDATEPLNWQVLGQIYLILAAAGVEGAYERGVESFDNARGLDPTNPILTMRLAELEFTVGNREAARSLAEETVRLRPQFTEAIFLLTQLDVQDGRVEEAVTRSRDLISLEPQNSVRYYQLGVLLAANGDPAGAIEALERAVEINPEYANARYVLAVQYFGLGREDEAVAQLGIVRDLNPQNGSVEDLINSILVGEITNEDGLEVETVNEPDESQGEAVTESIEESALESNLISPVNIVPETETTTETTESDQGTTDSTDSETTENQ